MLRAVLMLPWILAAHSAQAGWTPNGGWTTAVAPHVSAPVTSLAERRLGLGAGFHMDLGMWSPKTRQQFGVRLSMDGFSGEPDDGGDLLSMGLLLTGGVDLDLTKKWMLQSWGGAGWNLRDTAGDPQQSFVLAGGVSVQRRARLRHIQVGWELSAAWLGAASGLMLQTGPTLRWQR